MREGLTSFENALDLVHGLLAESELVSGVLLKVDLEFKKLQIWKYQLNTAPACLFASGGRIVRGDLLS